jgi:HK97 family phage prohead protease
LEHKTFHLEVKSIDDAGEFSGYASTFGNKDLDGDIVVKGAFKATINSKRQIPILWLHKQDEPIGISLEMKEDDHGLFTRGKLAIDTELGARALALMKLGTLNSLSIGYQVIQQERTKTARYLKEIKLLEYSVVVWPANTEATIDAIKGKSMTTFKEALDAHQLRQDLSNQAWRVEDAKDDSMDSIMSDDSMDKIAKKASARKTLHDAADAHADLMDQRIDAQPDVDPAEAAKTAAEPVEVKAARKGMDAAIAAHVEGERKCAKAMDLMHQGATLHTKGIVMARQLTYAAIAAGDDKTVAAAAGKAATAAAAKAADDELAAKTVKATEDAAELAEFNAAIEAARLKIAA